MEWTEIRYMTIIMDFILRFIIIRMRGIVMPLMGMGKVLLMDIDCGCKLSMIKI